MLRAKLLALIALLSLAAVACGGDGTTPSAGGTTPPGTPPQPTANSSPLNNQGTLDASGMSRLTLELDDRYFKPTFLKAKPGQALNIELENEGGLLHTFTITSLGIDEQVAPGTTEEIDVTLPSGATADLAFFCRFHVGAGMRGAFFFGASPSAAGTPADEPDPY